LTILDIRQGNLMAGWYVPSRRHSQDAILQFRARFDRTTGHGDRIFIAKSEGKLGKIFLWHGVQLSQEGPWFKSVFP
jgi:hypothetical protein